MFHAIVATPGTSGDAETIGYPPCRSDTWPASATDTSQFARVAAAIGDVPERSIARAFSAPFPSAIHATVIRFPTAATFAYAWYPSTGVFSVVAPIRIGADQAPKPDRSRKNTLPVVASVHTAYRFTGPNAVLAAATIG